MTKLESIFALLKDRPDPSIDQAMAAALPTADPQAQQLIVEHLLHRQQAGACVQVVRHFHRLDETLQEQIVAQVHELYGQLRQAADQLQTHGPENVLAIIRRSGDAKLAYLVNELLCHGTSAVRHQAAETLLSLTQRAQQLQDQQLLEPADRFYLHQAIQEALATFNHHRQAVALVSVLMALGQPDPALHQALADPRHPALPALIRLIQNADDSVAHRALIPMLGDPPLANTVLAILAKLARSAGTGTDQSNAPSPRSNVSDGLEQVLTQSHLLLVGSIHRTLAKAADPESLLPRVKVMVAWPQPTSRALPAWIMSLKLDLSRKVDLLSAFRDHSDPATRLAALRRLMELIADGQAAGVYPVISGFCADPDLVIARIALQRLLCSSWDGLPRLLSSLTHSSHAELRRIASQRLAPHVFERLCRSWPHLQPSQRLAAGRALIKINPNFPAQLSEQLVLPERRARLVALSMIQSLGQGPLFEQALQVLARDVDPTVASAAVRALGTSESPSTVALLERLLIHPDARIRANAIESLHQLQQTERMAHLFPSLVKDRHGRPRANAIRAWLSISPTQALEALGHMLADADARHRVSALWLVDELALLDLARPVADLAVSDPLLAVRHRAQRVVKRLLDSSSSAGEHVHHLVASRASAADVDPSATDTTGLVAGSGSTGGRA